MRLSPDADGSSYFNRLAHGLNCRFVLSERDAMKKLPKKYAGVMFSFYASAVMVLIVSGVLVALNTGLDAGYPLRLAKSYLITWPVAFASLLAVRPLVAKLVAASVEG